MMAIFIVEPPYVNFCSYTFKLWNTITKSSSTTTNTNIEHPEQHHQQQTHCPTSNWTSFSIAHWKRTCSWVVLLLVLLSSRVTMTGATTAAALGRRFPPEEEEKISEIQQRQQERQWHEQSTYSFQTFLSELSFSRESAVLMAEGKQHAAGLRRSSSSTKPLKTATSMTSSTSTASTKSTSTVSTASTASAIWQSLFCMSPDERDVYFDAYEMMEPAKYGDSAVGAPTNYGNSASPSITQSTQSMKKICLKSRPSTLTTTSTATTLKIRGGHQHGGDGGDYYDGGAGDTSTSSTRARDYWNNGPASPPRQYSTQYKLSQQHEQQLHQYEAYCQSSPRREYSNTNTYPDDPEEEKELYSDESERERDHFDQAFSRKPGPPAPVELPLRFLRAGKGDAEEGKRRYLATLQWRRENGMDEVLTEAFPHFETVKKFYPHFFHLEGHKGEPVFYELPPKTNLAALRKAGVDLDTLLHHYAMVTEFQWQFVERNDFARSITIIDLDGMRMTDFAGEVVDYVRKCSSFTGQHYPERAGTVMVVNVPGWFKMIWSVVKPMVDEVTLQKIKILRGREEILNELLQRIPIENIPPEYGGHSMPLGHSPQEMLLRDLMQHNNNLSMGDFSCGGCMASPPCRFCSWVPARSY